MCRTLNMAPNVAGVTLLAFGNGSPDVFAGLASVLESDGVMAFTGIVSAGTFVTSLVVGCVAIVSGPTLVYKGFNRDIGFYLLAVISVMMCYLSSHIHVWQSIMLLALYVTFVVTVTLCQDSWVPPVERSLRSDNVAASYANDGQQVMLEGLGLRKAADQKTGIRGAGFEGVFAAD